VIRVIDERVDDIPTRWHDVPGVDLDRLPPRLADMFDRECAGVEGYGITCFGEAQFKADSIRRGYFKAMADASEGGADQDGSIEAANGWLARQKDQRDVALAALWATMAKSPTPISLQALYDGELDYLEIADPVPIPKRPQDRKPGKAKAGPARRPEQPADL
jgi:hypothetical protein